MPFENLPARCHAHTETLVGLHPHNQELHDRYSQCLRASDPVFTHATRPVVCEFVVEVTTDMCRGKNFDGQIGRPS
jgi:hypothetical protein